MNLKSKISPVDIQQREYTRDDLNKALQVVNELIKNVFTPGELVASSLQFVLLPRNDVLSLAASGYGLPYGGVYYDENGFLKVVRKADVFAPSFTTRVTMGTVTVTV